MKLQHFKPIINSMLDLFITSRVRRKVITVFAKYPEFKTHVRGLAKVIKEDPGNVQRELAKLEKAGLIKSHKEGATKIYQTDTSYPIFEELRSIVIKTQDLQEDS